MTLSRVDAFLFNEKPLWWILVYESPVKYGALYQASGDQLSGFLQYLQSKEKEGTQRYKDLEWWIDFCLTMWPFPQIGNNFLNDLNPEFLFESLTNFLKQECRDFETKRHAFVNDGETLRMVEYYPWCKNTGEAFDKKMKMIVDEIRENVNMELEREAISSDGIIVDDNISIYTNLLTDGWVFLENIENR